MYISAEWLGPLEDALLKAERKHSGSNSMLSEIFNDLHELVRCHIGPHCRYQDHFDNPGKAACSAFEAINLFMGDGVDYFAHRLINDLRGEEKQEVRAIRGGGWSSLVYACRIANRNWFPLHEYSNCIRFRVALAQKRSGLEKRS